MKDYKISVKLTLGFVYAAMVLLALLTVTFPFLVEWFVEIRQKDPNLATTIMIISYPCVPFAAAMLIAMRNLLVNLNRGLVLGDANIRHLKVIAISCLGAGIIMIAGGFKYMPFWISGLAAIFGALIVAVIGKMFSVALGAKREQEYKSVREKYEKDDNIGNR